MAQTNIVKETKNFKYNDLKVYSSTEWLANNSKKYRQIFNSKQTTYIYVELSFINKRFDDEPWNVNVELKCFEAGLKKKICSLEFNKKVSKRDHIVYIREGWGNKREGAFWEKGTYYWEAWIEGKKVGTRYFYIEDYGLDLESFQDNFLAIKSMRMYEGTFDDSDSDMKNYLKVFSADDTRYVFTEIIFENLNFNADWHLELFIKFYTEARELKGQVVKLQRIRKEEDEIVINAGWGSNVKGSWRPGQYAVEMIILDRLVAVLPFEVAFDAEEGIMPVRLFKGGKSELLLPDEEREQNFEEVMVKFEGLIGLSKIKQKISEHSSYIKYLQLRKEKGLKEEEDINIHSVFTGNPGTGKTTVAKMMGAIYKKMGLLSKGHVFEVDRSDLVGEYIGQTAPKVKEAINKAKGGVLFIDEAYALARTNDDSKDFGREAIEILVKEMSNGTGDMAIIVAGYPKEMKHFINSNPGLKSRFKQYFEFPDYLPQELVEIAHYAAEEQGVVFASTAKERLDELIIEAYRNRDASFGNARFVNDLVEKAKINLGLRVMLNENPMALSDEVLNTIEFEDVDKIRLEEDQTLPNIPIDNELLENSLKELDELIGMPEIKKEIYELVDVVKYHKKVDKNVLNSFYLHTIFIGNPGTGKTTVARILTKIYKALGLLERGHIIETDRQGLVAGFIGQTAIKTNERINEAQGGVLFIDEAYALSHYNGLQGDYGNEAIQTLLKRMEDNRGQFFVFAAGYPENMDRFLKANPGLRSRFDKILKFEDYSDGELLEIAESMFALKDYRLQQPAREFLFEYLKTLYLQRNKYFGNAREVRKIVLEIIKNQNLRLATQKKGKGQPRNFEICLDDLKFLKDAQDKDLFRRERIGFNK